MAVDSEDSLGSTVARGARSLLLSQVGKVLLQIAGLIVLSRLLVPAEFGYVAVATVIVGAGEILRDFGLSAAAIRAPELTSRQRDVLFWLNSGIGVVLAAVLIAAAGPLSGIFGTPQLAGSLAVLSSVFVLNGANSQYRASLNRSMRFGSMALVDLAAPAVGLVGAISAALAGWSYWALVTQTVLTAMATLILTVVAGPWLPRLPRRRSGAGSIVRFGGHLASSQVLTYLGNNIDTLALGAFSSPTAVGLYSRSFQLVMNPLNQLKSPAMSVALPALSRMRDDPARYESFLLRGQATIGYIVVPLAAVLAGAAAPVVEVVLGQAWSAAVPIVALLAVAAAIQQLASVANWIFVSASLGVQLQRYSLVSLVLKLVGVLSLVALGPVGVAAGYLGAVMLGWPLALLWAARGAHVNIVTLMQQTGRLMSVSLAAGGAAWAASNLTADLLPLARIGVAVGAAGLIYAVLIVSIAGLRKDYTLVRSSVAMALSRRKR